ncbi:hypothetical protein RISW2_10690 [Roseivivax isoporae LMG 25204]|uniref:PhoD-like phosphatase domain-containing protein n=2 Tax=Roseivivax TaxID=93682 RepID=X7F5B6_9RHOB|nr:hypothetical protein RISW2_10690 [Roseivivax isoporae LMG 25204]
MFRGLAERSVRLAALVVRDDDSRPPALTAGGRSHPALRLATVAGHGVWRYDFALPLGTVSDYGLAGRTHRVDTRYEGDLHVGFVSCNGEENGDLDRDADERNAMWQRLRAQHATRPLHVLLHGGDQVYADEATDGHRLSDGWPDELPETAAPADLDDLRLHLRERFLHRYAITYAAPGFAELAAEVPSLMMWDDHDICDGWGSLGDVERTAIGQTLFRTAREAFLLYQHAATDDDVPDLFLDPEGLSLGFRRDLPGLTILAPDLRSERTRARIMGPNGWDRFDAALADLQERVFLVSSVPLLGPRLSLVERLMQLTRRMERYEDDLRDQWQSRAHRAEWARMLRRLIDVEARGHRVTAISGEIHLATRATLDTGRPEPLHQLVASGISHRAPPRLYAMTLGTLARFGEAPIPEHPIRIAPLPGQRHNYTAERNYLTLARKRGTWSARWDLEDSGTTGWLSI